MQFSLRSLFILMAAVCVYCATLSFPVVISGPLYWALVSLTPAYWIVGTIYSRGSRRAFYIGGLSTAVAPYIILIILSVVFVFEGPWRWGRWYDWDNNIIMNFIISIVLILPSIFTVLGGWVGYGIFHLVQEPQPASTSQSTTSYPIH